PGLDATVCSGSASGINFAVAGGSVAAPTFNITSLTSTGLTIVGGAPNTGNNLAPNVIFDDAWRNVTTAPIDAVYSVVPVSSGGCLGDPLDVTLTVDPEPVMTNGPITVCS